MIPVSTLAVGHLVPLHISNNEYGVPTLGAGREFRIPSYINSKNSKYVFLNDAFQNIENLSKAQNQNYRWNVLHFGFNEESGTYVTVMLQNKKRREFKVLWRTLDQLANKLSSNDKDCILINNTFLCRIKNRIGVLLHVTAEIIPANLIWIIPAKGMPATLVI